MTQPQPQHTEKTKTQKTSTRMGRYFNAVSLDLAVINAFLLLKCK